MYYRNCKLVLSTAGKLALDGSNTLRPFTSWRQHPHMRHLGLVMDDLPLSTDLVHISSLQLYKKSSGSYLYFLITPRSPPSGWRGVGEGNRSWGLFSPLIKHLGDLRRTSLHPYIILISELHLDGRRRSSVGDLLWYCCCRRSLW